MERLLESKMKFWVACILALCALMLSSTASFASDALPSWKDRAAKKRIVAFVKAVSEKGGKFYVAPKDRIAVFDNDGTLWCEQPIYPQFVFALDRVKKMARSNSKLAADPLFKAAIDDDYDSLAKSGAEGIQKLIGATHGGMTAGQFDTIVSEWMLKSKHPKYGKPFNQCVYKPMLELLNYLRANQFSTYIVSGGGRDFMRPWARQTYGFSPDHIVGSSCKLEFRDGNVYRTEKIAFLNDGKEKPVGIQSQIGKRPIAAFGNSDGDLEMLSWTWEKEKEASGKRLCVLVRHTDSDREYKYDRDSKVGRLDKALREAKDKKWIVIDMKKDWKKVFPFD